MYLLIFDDDSRVANFLTLIARLRGAEVAVALTEREFREICTTSPPDAILLDLALGVSDGVEQLRFLRSIDYRGVVTLMSGFDARVLGAAEQIGRSLGISLTTKPLQKPMRAADVRAALDEIEACMGKAIVTSVPESAPASLTAASAEVQPVEIAQAIDRGEMELFFQPIVSAIDSAVMQVEALIRWRRRDGSVWTPDRFLPAAERDPEVIDKMSTWVIETALVHHRDLATYGFRIPIAVNVSGVNLRSLDFPDRVAELVGMAQLTPAALAFEVTESVAVDDADATVGILTRLRLKGFDIAIDDLGMGHSSLNSLRQIPFSQIKIDKSFIGGILSSHDSLSIVASVIGMARSMQITSVAEGVESAEIAKMLTKLGIDRQQGYFFSRPLAFSDLVDWLKIRRNQYGDARARS